VSRDALRARLQRAESAIATAYRSCSACDEWPAATASLIDGDSAQSMLGPNPWPAAGGACPTCGRRPSWALTVTVVDSIAEADVVRSASRPDEPHIAVTRHQADFLRCESKTAVFIGGLGAGKSVAAALWLLLRLVRYPRARHYVIGTTFAMLKAGTHITLRGLLDDLGWSYTYNRSTLTIAIESGPARGAEVLFWSSETFTTTKGLEVDSCVVEELAEWQSAESAFAYISGRLRQSPPASRHHPDIEPRLRVASNPPQSLSHFVYERFIAPPDDAEAAKARPTVFLTRTLDNPLIPQRDEYVAMLRAIMSPSVFRSQVLGEFVEIGAMRVYEQFTHRLHVRDKVEGIGAVRYDPTKPLAVGLDFGSRMGVAIMMQVHRLTAAVKGLQSVVVFVVDEIAVESSYTQKILDAFADRYRGSQQPASVYWYGDATGERAGSTGPADWEIVRRFLSARGYAGEVKKDSTNPLKVDRVAAMNHKLLDADGNVGLVVAPHCKTLIRDLATVKWKDVGTGRIIDHGKAGEAILSHASDGAGYFVAYEFGVMPRARGVVHDHPFGRWRER
jgi:hypothetical protein